MKQNAYALVAGENGDIFELEGFSALGMSGDEFIKLDKTNTQILPEGSEIMYLPDRAPVLFNNKTKKYEVVEFNPYDPGERIFAVSAFNSPGYVITLNSAYEEKEGAKPLPLFSYGAVGLIGDDFVSAVYQVDKEDRQDLDLMPIEGVKSGLDKKLEIYPENRLIYHLKKCALEWGCPAAKNFFLSRYEAPLPTSRICNANCLGCISLQRDKFISSCQNRIDFTPKPHEIAEVALSHIKAVEKSIVSFGQGCEGDPLLAWETILPAVEIIRKETDMGTINMNTNGSLPHVMEKLFKAGMDSIRVSMNSARKEYYLKYFRPKYEFEDVLKTIETARKYDVHVSINYLNMPGFTDLEPEVEALEKLIEKYDINFIQWRNLNYDPKLYFKQIFHGEKINEKAMGIPGLIKRLKEKYPKLAHGYFNPPKESLNFNGQMIEK